MEKIIALEQCTSAVQNEQIKLECNAKDCAICQRDRDERGNLNNIPPYEFWYKKPAGDVLLGKRYIQIGQRLRITVLLRNRPQVYNGVVTGLRDALIVRLDPQTVVRGLRRLEDDDPMMRTIQRHGNYTA